MGNKVSFFDVKNDFANQQYRSSENQVVFTFNKNYFNQTFNLLKTIIKYNKVSFIFVCDYCDDELLSSIKNSLVGIRLVVVSSAGYFNTKRWPLVTTFRLYLPWILSDIKKVLYLDSDILCCGNFDELFSLNCRIAMVPEVSGTISNWLKNKYKLNRYFYYNAGVCIMNLSMIRGSVDIKEIDTEFIAKLDMYILNDQDFMNIYFDDIYPLDIKYNNQIYEFRNSYYYAFIMHNSIFLHFSYLKPWEDKTDLFYAKLYLKYSEDNNMIRTVKKVIKKNNYWFFKYRIKRFLIKNNEK